MKTTKVSQAKIYSIFRICYFSFFCCISWNTFGQENNAANTPSIAGAWTWTTQQSDGGLFTSVMDIRIGSKGILTGAIRNPKGESIPFESVTLKGNLIHIILKYQIMGQTFKASYRGKPETNEIKGEVVIQFQDRTLRRIWKASRLREFPLTGEWDWKLSTPDGNELKATLSLLHDTNGVSGRLKSDQFDMPLQEVSFKDGQLKFITQREEDGGIFHSIGKWHGNLLSGVVSSPSIGEELKLPWEAKRRR